MNSTLEFKECKEAKESKESENDSYLEVKNFSISYNVPYYKTQSFRDTFVTAISAPVDFFFKTDDRVLLLDNISLKIKKGDRVGVLGNNGSGKTSFCRYVCGIHTENMNAIKVKGIVKGIFDTEVAILPELSGRENLELLTHFFLPRDI